jgi:hypothetical protein
MSPFNLFGVTADEVEAFRVSSWRARDFRCEELCNNALNGNLDVLREVADLLTRRRSPQG